MKKGGILQIITPVGFIRQRDDRSEQLRNLITTFDSTIEIHETETIFPTVGALKGGISICYVNTSKPSPGYIRIKNIIQNNEFEVDNNFIKKYKIIPAFRAHYETLKRFFQSGGSNLTDDYMGSKFGINPYTDRFDEKHKGGSRIKTEELSKKTYGYVAHYPGKNGFDPYIYYSKDKKIDSYLSNKWCVIQHEMNLRKPIVVAPGDYIGLFFILASFETQEEAVNYVDYLKSDIIQMHLRCWVVSIKASLKPYYQIPVIDFTKKVTKERLQKEFNIDSELQKEITQTIKDIKRQTNL